ncbi:MAG: hypothetical protein OXC00_00145 [Acidimicrobiaceae bacterium]|nr:hypothetical protein [Acidimicrobiaceae bacterium]
MEYIPRLVDAQFSQARRTHPVVLVTGARGVGKTTTAMQAARSRAFLDDAATRTHISNIRSDKSDRIWAAPISVLWH